MTNLFDALEEERGSTREVDNETVWAYRLRIPDLNLDPNEHETLREGITANYEVVNELIERALKMRSPSGYFVMALRRIATEGWPPGTATVSPGRDAKLRQRLMRDAEGKRRAEFWTGWADRDRWHDEEEEWERYVRREHEDAGIPSAAAEAIKAARAAVPQLAKVPAAGSRSVTRYLEPGP